MTNSETLRWTVSGDFITDIARQWFYLERQPFEKVHELLISCMQGSDETQYDLDKHVDDILTFKSKLSGDTRDDTYGLYDETEQEKLKTKYPEYKYYDYLKQDKKIPFAECEYGFISPVGEFVPVEWCNHSQWATDYVKAHDLWEDMFEHGQGNCTDYIVYTKGYILLENPYQGEALIQQPDKITKRQRETLYDYYMYHHREQDAINLFKELDN